MDAIDELFKKTNALTERFRKNDRIRISPAPQRKMQNTKTPLPSIHRYGPEDRPPSLTINQKTKK